MARNQNLIPTPVTDKNGVPTTRWKRPVASPAATVFAPPPSVWDDRKEAQREVDEALSRDGYVMSTIILDVLNMQGCSREVRDKFKSGLNQGLMGSLDMKFDGRYGAVIPFIKNCVMEQSPQSLNNAALFIDLLDRCQDRYGNTGTKDDGNDMFGKFIFGLQWQHQGSHKDFSSYEGGREQGEALLKGITTLPMPYRNYSSEGHRSSYYIPYRGLVGLFEKRPQDAERIISLLKERKLPVSTEEDLKNVESLLDAAETSALSSGAL